MCILGPSSHTCLNQPIILLVTEAGMDIDLTTLKLIESQVLIIIIMGRVLLIAVPFAFSSG